MEITKSNTLLKRGFQPEKRIVSATRNKEKELERNKEEKTRKEEEEEDSWGEGREKRRGRGSCRESILKEIKEKAIERVREERKCTMGDGHLCVAPDQAREIEKNSYRRFSSTG